MAQEHVAVLIDAAGGQARLGQELGIAQQSVAKWLRAGQIPADRVHAALAAAMAIRTREQWPQTWLPAPHHLHPSLTPVDALAAAAPVKAPPARPKKKPLCKADLDLIADLI